MTDRATRPADRAPATETVRRIHLPQKLRNLELGLLIVACIINAGAIGLVALTIGVGAACLGVLRVCRQALVPLWGQQIGLDPAQVSLLFGISSAIDMLFFYPVGMVSDRYGRRAVALPCLALLSLGFLARPLTASFAGLAVVGALMGIGNGLGSGIVMTLGADLAPPDGRAAFLGAWRLISDVGQAGGPLLAAAATAIATLGAASVTIGVLGLGGVAIFAIFLPSRPEPVAARTG